MPGIYRSTCVKRVNFQKMKSSVLVGLSRRAAVTHLCSGTYEFRILMQGVNAFYGGITENNIAEQYSLNPFLNILTL